MPSIVEITVKFTDDEPVFKALMRENNGGRPGDLIKRKLKQLRRAEAMKIKRLLKHNNKAKSPANLRS